MSQKSSMLFSLAGKVSTWPKRALTSACRNRTPPYDEVVLREQLRADYMALSELKEDAEPISDKLADSAADKRLVVGYMMDNPGWALANIRQKYRDEYDNEFGNAGCPFENNGNKNACNGCPVPGRVFGDMEREMKEEISQ